MVLENEFLTAKNKNKLLSLMLYKNQLKYIKDLNIKFDISKMVEKVWNALQDVDLGKVLLNRNPFDSNKPDNRQAEFHTSERGEKKKPWTSKEIAVSQVNMQSTE